MAALEQRVGLEVGVAAELHDAFGELVGVRQFLIGVHQELFGDLRRIAPMRGVVVAPVAQHADELGGQGVVEQAHDLVAPRAVGRRHRAFFTVALGGLDRALVELKAVVGAGLGFGRHGGPRAAVMGGMSVNLGSTRRAHDRPPAHPAVGQR